MANKSSKQKLVQSQAQIQTLSPQQVLLARMLELTTVEMEDRVRGEIIDNPAIESVAPENVGLFEEHDSTEMPDANSADDYRVEDDIPDYYGWDYHSRRTTAVDIPTSADVSFGESLLEQLGELSLDENDLTSSSRLWLRGSSRSLWMPVSASPIPPAAPASA